MMVAPQISAAPPETAVIGVIESFDAVPTGPFQKGFLESWRWTDEKRQRAREWSSLEIIPAPEGDGRALRIRVNDPQALADGAQSFVRLAPYFPPEADAVRIRLMVVSGQASIHVGGPTAYYGNSDVFTEPQTIRAEAKPQWVDVICNFNHPTWRNYRRSGFSTDAPRNYYNRWAQEPVGVFLGTDSKGEVLIDRIDLVGLGEGRAFPVFTPAQIQQVRPIADFEDGKLDQSFNLYMSATETEWFDESWKRGKPLRFPPMTLSVADAGLDGRRSLECKGRTAEEVHCTGVRTEGPEQANAIAASISADAVGQTNTLVGTGPTVPIDFLVFVAPAGRAFPWKSFGPSDALRAMGGPGFDYQFTHRALAGLTGVDFAIYQTRRYLTPSEWSKLVLPAADFTCIYGHGSMRERFLGHEPLRCGEVVAVAWLNPWCRVGRRDSTVTTRLDSLVRQGAGISCRAPLLLAGARPEATEPSRRKHRQPSHPAHLAFGRRRPGGGRVAFPDSIRLSAACRPQLGVNAARRFSARPRSHGHRHPCPTRAAGTAGASCCGCAERGGRRRSRT